MPVLHPVPRALLVLIALLLAACASADPPAGSPTPALPVVVSIPYPAFAVATPPAHLHDQPAGTPGALLPRGTDVLVEALVPVGAADVWYRVTTADGRSGWVPAAALSLIEARPSATPTARPPLPATPTLPPPATPTPRPLAVTGSALGLFLRLQPGSGTIIRAYPDGTLVIPLGEMVHLEGRRWLRVRAPDGQEGWMAAEYLQPAS